MIAKALHPSNDELFSYGAARINLEMELKQAVADRVLMVRNPAGLGRHTFPVGDALQRAVLIPNLDLEPFLAERGIELRLTPHGSGPVYWTLENAAAALQEQEGWHNGTRADFQDQLQEAAQRGEVVIRDPHTCLPTSSKDARTYWEYVMPADVNAWLEKMEAPYRWNAATDTTAEATRPHVAGKKWTPEKLEELRAFRETNTMPQTALKFDITEQRIRQLLPTKKAVKKGFSAFTQHIK